MAVYTKLDDGEILEVLAHFSISSVKLIEGIAKGSENSNYFVETASGKYILTIFENRVNEENIPYILDTLTKLSEANIICPNIIAATSGQRRYTLPSGKICILQTFMDGDDVLAPSQLQCYGAGKTLAALHNVSNTLDTPSIENSMGLNSISGIFSEMKKMKGADERKEVLELITQEISYQNGLKSINVPSGFIHGDYFKDNVLFTETIVSGVIDFWFSCEGAYIYDLAIALNAWGFDDGKFSESNFIAFLQGYTDRRVLNESERTHLPNMLRLSALRFLVTRLYDEINGKNPKIMANKPSQTWQMRLKYHQDKSWEF
tara:strand:- start:187358 stop:188311 length:954 start_codon:yes stop_codon:yes gene_type:complete